MELFAPDTYVKRRKKLKKIMKKGRILLVGNDNSSINFKDNWYPFRQDSTFLYYFGISLPGLIALIDVEEDRDILFGNELTMDDIIWTGSQPSLAELAARVGVKNVQPRAKLVNYINEDIHYLPPYRSDQTVLLSRLIHKKVRKVEKKYSIDLIKAVVSQRSIKSEEEIAELDKAVSITDDMHLRVMHAAKPGMKEHELVGIASQTAYENHVAFSFPPILTKEGQTLHNHSYSHELGEGDMVLFDGGCESPKHYAGDITRTFPVSSQFTSRQKDMYDIVYQAYDAAVSALEPGVLFRDIHKLASRTLVAGLKDLGLMKGDVDEAVREGAHTLFLQCGLGHMLGLDVHDMENLGEKYVGYTKDLKKSKEFGWKSLRLGRQLEEGFVITIEPGIYMIPELFDMRKSEGKYERFVDYNKLEEYRDFGGIRLEDDFVITNEGSRLLGKELPRTSIEIEEFCRGR